MVVSVTPLPPNPFSEQTEPDSYNAYAVCLRLESKASNDTAPEAITARLLGHLLHFSKTTGRTDAVTEMTADIKRGESKNEMLAVGDHYVTYLVKTFRRAKGPTPQPSNHPSNPDADLRADFYRATLVEAPKDHRDARKQALVRDGYKCVITHSQDTKYVKEHRDKWNGLQARELEAAHIIPEYINIASPDPLKLSKKHDAAGHIWRLLEMFGDGSLLNERNGRNAHALDNIMMLCHDVHAAYDRLDMWLEEFDPPERNKYRVHNNAPWEAPGYPFSVVEFTSPTPQLPLPNPRWIAVHAAVCRVAHLSGAAEYVEEQYRRLEDMDIMAFDGPEAIRDAEILSAQLRLVDVHG